MLEYLLHQTNLYLIMF